MKAIILTCILLSVATITAHPQQASESQVATSSRTIQAGVAGGVTTSLVFTAWAGYLFDGHQGIRLGYFKQQKHTLYLIGSGEDITDATRTISAQYQYRINVTEKFDFTLAAGPALMIPLYKEYKQYNLKNEWGAAFHLGMNLWTNRNNDGEAGAGIFSGIGYLQGSKLHRVYGEFGVAFRLNH